jgi:hypothetical protein
MRTDTVFRPLPLLAAFTVLLASTVVHGLWTQRWTSSEALDNAAARLGAVPATAGPWVGAEVDVDPDPFRQARAVSYWTRQYTCADSSASITVILMCGRAGHMAVHSPDVCYRGAGYEMVGEQRREMVTVSSGVQAALWTAHFRQPARLTGRALQIHWSWTSDGSWQAPSSPRWTFGGAPYLYKLYIVSDAAPDSAGRNVTTEFLQEFLPTLQRSLFSPAGKGPEL